MATAGNAFEQMQIELRNREGELRANSDRLSAVLASLFEGIIAIDQDRKVLLANRAAGVLIDIPYHELLNRPIYELIRNPTVEQCVEEVFQSHRTIAREIETKRQPRRVLSIRFYMDRAIRWRGSGGRGTRCDQSSPTGNHAPRFRSQCLARIENSSVIDQGLLGNAPIGSHRRSSPSTAFCRADRRASQSA